MAGNCGRLHRRGWALPSTSPCRSPGRQAMTLPSTTASLSSSTVAAAAASGPMAGAFRRSAAASTATVYVVDDVEAVRRSLDWLISSVNLPVRTFASARAFLESYRSGEEGCVVVDVRMPGMSGLELQRKLAKAASHLPIIIITRSEEHTSELQSLMRISYAVFCLKKKKYTTSNS